MKKCEFCKEKIQSKATKCIHCGEFQKKPVKPFYKKWWFIGFAILFFISLILPDSMKQQTNTSSEQTKESNSIITREQEKKGQKEVPKYELIEKVSSGNLNNFYILYTSSNKEAKIEKDVRIIKTDLCNSKCNIHLFKEKDTKGLYKKYPLANEELIYVADRQIGTLTFTDDFMYYPLQDFAYKEAGGKNYQK